MKLKKENITFGELVKLDKLPEEIEEMLENEEWSKPYTDIDELLSDLFKEGIDNDCIY